MIEEIKLIEKDEQRQLSIITERGYFTKIRARKSKTFI